MAEPLKLDERELSKADERASPGAPIIHEVIRREGEEELARTSSALAWSGGLAGITIGFSVVVEGVLRAHLPDAPWTHLVSKLGFPVGFVLVIMGREQLFTENTLLPIIPLLVTRSFKTLSNVARLWAVVLVANLAGAYLFAWVLSKSGLFDEKYKVVFTEMGRHALEGAFGTHFVKGVFAGWLIALLVWILGGMKNISLAVIFLVVYVIGVADFSHVVSGSIDGMVWTMREGAGWQPYFARFLAPVLLGNIVGGLALVAVANHAQVVAGGGKTKTGGREGGSR